MTNDFPSGKESREIIYRECSGGVENDQLLAAGNYLRYFGDPGIGFIRLDKKEPMTSCIGRDTKCQIRLD